MILRLSAVSQMRCKGRLSRQRDRETHEWKYVLRGQTLEGQGAFVVAKLGLLGSLYILTVYEE